MDVKPPPGAEIYDNLAEAYDLTGQSRFSLKMVGYMLEMLALRRFKGRKICDLACGTGAAAVALARRKFVVTGVDGSSAMLARAKRRADRWDISVDWRQGDLTALDLPGGYDMATCFFDSLNHLTEPQQLRQAFFGVRRALAPGGLFFFDMNTPYALAQVWGQSTDSYVDPRYARIWRTRYDAASGLARLEATYFLGRHDGRYDRVDAVHTARGYTPAEVEAALNEAGLQLLEAYECLGFEPADENTYRVAYLAQA
jgi:ubiquinone/menaquinone biosynthesis C-methylase UbiE